QCSIGDPPEARRRSGISESASVDFNTGSIGNEPLLECGGSTPLWMGPYRRREPDAHPKRCPATALQNGLIAENHVGREAELVQVAAAADDAELAAHAELDNVVQLDAGADRHGQFVVPCGAARAEVEQVAAFEADVARVTVHRVMFEVELDER